MGLLQTGDILRWEISLSLECRNTTIRNKRVRHAEQLVSQAFCCLRDAVPTSGRLTISFFLLRNIEYDASR
jgi:hypothetical protein